MADNQDPPSASNADMAKPSDAPAAAADGASSEQPSKEPYKNPRHSGHKRSQMGGKNKERGRNEWQREDYQDRKRRKLNKNGEAVEEAPKPNPFFTEEEIAAEEKRPKRKVACMIGYSGTGYRGMQINGDEPTIERDIFRAFVKAGAISKANANDPRKSSLVRCARTDKGVHAAGNVISLKLIIEDEDVVDKINEALPEQIRIWGIQRTNNAFSCYQGCDSRWYEYLMPSYCLLPPHPQTYLGQQVAALAKEHGYEDTLEALNADVKDFWETVEENDIKPVLNSLDPELKAQVLERVHTISEEDREIEKEDKADDEARAKPMETQTGVSMESFQPKKRELGPLDFALRDIKAAYVAAKRRYRISPERLTRLQDALSQYKGTKNFHNYTVQKSFHDPSAKRHIKSFVVNPEPITIGDTEWLSLKVHGQSFMMHQIRKMVGLASLIVRCGTPIERVQESYKVNKMAIPKAPGLGLLLERPVFDAYNNKAVSLQKETIDFGKYDDRMQAFKDEHIYKRIFEVEEKDSTFHTFFNQIDQFKSNHFLWVTAGGMGVAQIETNKTQQDVDKQLGDENENPEGGEG